MVMGHKKKRSRQVLAMEIPIGGLTYKVIFKKLKQKHPGWERVGTCLFDAREIHIDPTVMNKEEVYFTLFHEIIHATIESVMHRDKIDIQSDNFIHPFSRNLWGALIEAGLMKVQWKKHDNKKRLR